MRVRPYRESDRQAWDRYVLHHPAGTLFHLTGWKRSVERSFGHSAFYLVAENECVAAPEANSSTTDALSPIMGVFPLFLVKSFLFGKSLVSVPFAAYGGILASDPEVERALLDRAAEITRTEGLDYLEIRNEASPLPDLPSKDLYYNFKRELLPTEEDNLKAIPRKTRRMVRVGIANGLEAVTGGKELLEEFYHLFAFSYRNLGTPVFPKHYLGILLDEFGTSGFILIVRKDGKPLSGVMSFVYKDEVIPYYSGAYPESRRYAANDFLYWALMCHALQLGCRSFDFGRSKKDTGPFDFKRHWGFEPSPLPYQYYLHKLKTLPDLSPNNPKYRQGIELWKRLPLWVTTCVGPQIVKYIP